MDSKETHRNSNGTFKKGHFQNRGFIDFEKELKECSKCHVTKRFSEFYPSKNPLGIRSSCKECVGKMNSKRNYSDYYWKNKEKIAATKRKYHYGITEEQYNDLLEKQDNKCAACSDTTPLVVDHCHNTGAIRGLLCRKCNTALGQLNDSKERVEGLLRYISQ